MVATAGLAGAGVSAASASTASAAGGAVGRGHCARTVTGVHHGGLVADRGVLCLDRATQTGPVRVRPGAGLTITASVISGAVTAARARSVRICGSTIIGRLHVSATAGPVTAGAGSTSCLGDTSHGPLVISGSARRVQVTGLRQTGPVTLSGNTAGVTLSRGSVGGTVTVRGNRGHARVLISANAVSRALVCAANQPAPGDRHRPNTVSGTASGQCRTLVPSPPRRQALPPLPQDASSTLPNLNYGQAVGDFTGAGHDQLAYAQDGQLKIADVSKFGGQLLRSTQTDLQAPPNHGLDDVGPVWENDCIISSYCDQLRNNGATYGLTSVKVAASASNIYMAGATWGDPAAGSYHLHLYKLPHDGSCASASCAEKTVSLPSIFGNSATRLIVVTSLATGVVGGRTLIAVGLSDEGILIFNDQLQQVAQLGDFSAPDDSQTPVTSLAFGASTGPGEDGLLAVGVESPYRMYVGYHLNPDGTKKNVWVTPVGEVSGEAAMGATYAHLGGRLVAVFTRSDGDVIALNPDTGDLITDLPGGLRSGLALELSALTPWDGGPGDQDLAVGMNGGTGVEVLKDEDGTLERVPFAPNDTTTRTLDQLYNWWPGYGAGRLQVANNSPGAVSIAMASRSDPGYGCWLNTSVIGGPSAFPVADTPVAAGATSPDFFAAALTAGPDGSCASAQPDSKGERAGYVIIAPAGDSADEHIVKLTADAGGTLHLDSQVGGYLTASLSQVSSTPGSWGTWQLAVTGGSAPAASAAPTVTGHRLTAAPDPANYVAPTSPAADDPCRPVYRFDVTGARWANVISAGQVSAQLPPMTAQGSSDGGKTWQNLGQLMPATTPAVTADGTVTLGPASFFFQNAAGTATLPGVWTSGQSSQCPATGQAPVTEVRVLSGGQASAPVTLAALTPPPLNGGTGATPVQGVAAVPDGNSGAAAVARADGVDQAGLTLQLMPSSGGSIPATDPRYNLVYYRDDITKALITGLYQPGNYTGYTGIGPYPADGTTAQPTRNYLTTTSTAPGHLDPVMNDTGTVTGYTGSPFLVAASNNPLTPTGTANSGISVTGCGPSVCTLTIPPPKGSGPALYQAGGPDSGPVTGLQVSASAITGRDCLPLQAGNGVHNLGSASLDITAAQAKLDSTNQFWPSDSVDTALVTAGQLVPATDTPITSGTPC